MYFRYTNEANIISSGSDIAQRFPEIYNNIFQTGTYGAEFYNNYCNSSGQQFKNPEILMTMFTLLPKQHPIFILSKGDQVCSMYDDIEAEDLNQESLENAFERNIERQTGIDPKDHAQLPFLSVVVTSHTTDLYDKMSENNMDIKNWSLVAQQTSRHKIRFHKVNNVLYVLTNRWNWELARCCFTLFCKCFEENFDYNADTKTILQYLGESKEEEWANALTAYCEKIDLTKKLNMRQLKDAFDRIESGKMERMEAEINSLTANINSYMDTCSDFIKQRKEKQLVLFGYRNGNRSDNSELIDFITRNHALKSVQFHDNNRLRINLVTPCVSFDSELAEMWIKRTCPDKFKKLMTAIFLEQTYQLFLEASFILNINDGKIETYSNGLTNRYPRQPHIMRYNCWGNNRSMILKSISEHDLIRAFSCIISACQNLNFADGPVMREFQENNLRRIEELDTPCLKNLETDRMITYAEFLKETEPAPEPVPFQIPENPTTVTINGQTTQLPFAPVTTVGDIPEAVRAVPNPFEPEPDIIEPEEEE